MRFFISYIIISFLSLCANAQEQADKVIKIISFIDEAPYGYIDGSNKPTGFSYELIKTIMNEMKQPYEIIKFDSKNNYNTNIADLYTVLNDCDLVMSCTYTPSDKPVYFSNPYARLPYSVLSRDSIIYNDTNDLYDKEIIVQRGSPTHAAIIKFGECNFKRIIYVNEISTGIRLLSEGQGDYLICDEIISNIYTKQKIANNITTYMSKLPPLEVSYASKNEELINAINTTLGKMMTNNTYESIYNKWFGVKYEKNTNWYVYWIIGGISILLIILFAAIFILKRLVNKATEKSKTAYNHIVELNDSINLLMRNNKVEIFMYDDHQKALYTLENETFKREDKRFDELLQYIHLNDKKQYYNEYVQFLDGKSDIMTAHLRVFRPQEKKYFYYEYVLKPIKKEYNGKVYRFIFSRKDETERQEKMNEQKEMIQSFDLALRSANLIRWSFNLKTNHLNLTDAHQNKMILSETEINNCVHPADKKAFDNQMISVQLGNTMNNNILIFRLKIFNDNEFKPYEISSSIKYDNEYNPIAIYGIIKDLSEIKLFQQQIFELQYNMQLALEAGDMSAWKYDSEKQEFNILHASTLNNGNMTMSEYLAFTHPEDRTILPDAMMKIQTKLMDKTTVTFRMNTGYGWKWYLCSMTAIPTDGEIRYITGTRKELTKEVKI